MNFIKRTTIVHLFLFALFAGSFAVSLPLSAAECTSELEGKSDNELEKLLAACEEEIEQQNVKLADKQREATTIEAGIQVIDHRINTAQSEIKRRNIKIAQLASEIDDRSERIAFLEEKRDRIRESLGELIRESNEIGSFSAVEAVLSGRELSDFFQNLDDFQVLKINLNNTLAQVLEVKGETEVEKLTLEEKESAERTERYLRQKEKEREESLKREKSRILDATREEAKTYQQIIAEKETIKNQIRNRLFRTTGGTEMTFGEALQLVRMTEDKIGVNPALIMAVLSQESSVDNIIGKNIGKCTYNQSARNKAGTVMSDSQKPAFLAIMKELGMDPNTTPVSCPIYADGAYGGAMGAAQFMPNTWWNPATETGYKRRVGKVLGIDNPSPFDNLHAFTGTALYLSDALERCRTAFYTVKELRACTAAKYYSGIGSRGSRLTRHMYPKYSYGNQVAERAARFAKDIETLDL